jgi:uncharacterized protein
VKYLDKSIKSFILMSTFLILFSVLILAFFGYIYFFSTINTYNILILVLILGLIILTVFFVVSIVSVFLVYRRKEINNVFLIPVKLGLNILLPLVLFLSGVFKVNKDFVRNFYVTVNNILVNSKGGRFRPEQVLVLLPHCLQNSECGLKITNDISNCKRCGKCCIADIAKIAEEKHVMFAVVTGGTVARKITEQRKPKLILSVACERDLTSGIVDVGKIPVIGIINERPHGPCLNTFVDADSLRKTLDDVLI